jgi:hypothetical protein
VLTRLLAASRRRARALLAGDDGSPEHEGDAAPLRAFEALREHRGLIEAIFDAAGSQIFVKDLDGRYLLANRQIEIESGVPHDEMIGRTDHDIFPHHEADVWRANDLAVIESCRAVQVEETFDRPDGSQTFLSLKFPLLDAHGEPYALAGVSTNITARKNAEAALEAANRAKTDFLSHMSHELRTPLNAVMGFAQLLEMEDLTESQRESVEQVRKAGQHLLDLIGELLDIARIESGRLSLSIEPVELATVVADAVELMAPLAGERGVALEGRAPPGPAPLVVLADRQRLRQVLFNLVSNAVKYTPSGGHVSVACDRRDGGIVTVAVTDSGPGIAPEHMHLLFAPFERLGAEATAVEGTGVGLTLSKALAELMGGTIEVRSLVGAGSTFTLVLPAGEMQVAEAAELARADAAATAPPPRREGRAVVLYVEDNLANVRLVERILATRDDVDFVAAYTAGEGLERAAELRPALVLLDLHLPDVHGLEVLQRLRRDPRTRDLEVVIVSADTASPRRRRSLAAGARAFLAKPIDVGELLALVDDVLRSS